MSYGSRVYRQRNPKQEKGDKDGFFKKQPDRDKNAKPGATLQTKLAVNKPGDKYEQEADAVANSVVNQPSKNQGVQKKEISNIQRATMPEEKEKPGTNKKEEDVQLKADKVMKADDEKKKPMASGATKKKDEDVQRAADPVMEKEKKEKVQKKDDQLKEDEDKTGSVQAKRESDIQQRDAGLASRLKNSSDSGQRLSPEVLNEMNTSFDADFSHVRIHQDKDAASMNKDIQAQAFTHGKDIYFNEGKYNPNSSTGKKLLAHELTHTIQQGGKVPLAKTPAATVQPQKAEERNLQSTRFAGDEKLEEALDNKRHVKFGADGDHVKKLQQAMIDAGIFMPISTRKSGSPDGIFLSETQEAVKTFQKQCGLVGRDIDGIVGPITMGLFDARFSALPGDVVPPTTKKITVNVTRLFGSMVEPSQSFAYANTIYKNQANIEIVRGKEQTLGQSETEALIGKDQMLEMHFFGPSADELALFKVNQSSEEITVYFVKDISEKDFVLSPDAVAYAVTAKDKLGIIGIGLGNRGKFQTLAHEVGHMLGVDLHEKGGNGLLMAPGAPGYRLSPEAIKTMRSSAFAKDV